MLPVMLCPRRESNHFACDIVKALICTYVEKVIERYSSSPRTEYTCA